MQQSIKIRSVKYNFAMNIILKMSSFVFPLISLPYITRTLGAEGNGKVAFASSVITYFSMFAQLGIPTYGIRACAKCRDNKDELTKTVQELLVINFAAVGISYTMLIIGMITIPKLRQEPALMLINSLTIFLNMIGMEWLYQAIEQYRYITIRNIAFKIISIIAMFLLVHSPDDYIIYGTLTVVSAGGSNVLNLWNCRKVLTHKSYRGKYNFRQHLKPTFVFFALSVAVSIYTSMDSVMLGFISSEREVAYYALATKVKMVLATTVSALGPVLLPRMTYCLNHNQYNKFEEYIKKSLHFVLILAIPIVIFFVIMAPETVDVLGGIDYKEAIPCMQTVTLAVIPLGIGNVACQQILTPLGKERLTMISTIYGACLNFVVNAILIPKNGAVGAAIATVLAESIVMIIQVHYSWKEMKAAFLKIPYGKLFLINSIATGCLLAFKMMNFEWHAFMKCVVGAILFFGVYGALLLILMEPLVIQYGEPILRKLCAKVKNRE